jgi:hypothetical protein
MILSTASLFVPRPFVFDNANAAYLPRRRDLAEIKRSTINLRQQATLLQYLQWKWFLYRVTTTHECIYSLG